MIPSIACPPESTTRLLSTDIGRWTPPHETQLLVYLAGTVPGNILEIGCNNALTTREFALAYPDRQVFGIDYLEEQNTMVPEQQYERPVEEFGKWAAGLPNVTLQLVNSRTLEYEAFPDIGVVFIDGDHSYEGVKADTELALAYFKKRGHGLILWHDYSPTHPAWVQVKAYLDSEIAPHNPLTHYDTTWTVAMYVSA